MGLQLWAREEDISLLSQTVRVDFSHYKDSILTGNLKNPGDLGKSYSSFVFGRIRFWNSLEGDKTYFVSVRGNSMHNDGLVMTPNSWISVRYNRNGKTIDHKTKQSRAELIGTFPQDLVLSAFETYYRGCDVKRHGEKDEHFLIYRTLEREEEYSFPLPFFSK